MDAVISHSQDARAFARRLRDALTARGIETWTPEANIAPGSNIAIAIENAISESRAILFVMSPGATKSDWTTRELSIARAQYMSDGRPLIIPILADPSAEAPFFLRSFNWVDMTNDDQFEQGVERIAGALRSFATTTTTPSPEEQTAQLGQIAAEQEYLRSEVRQYSERYQATVRSALFASMILGLTSLSIAAIAFFPDPGTKWQLGIATASFAAGVVSTWIVGRLTGG